LITVRRDPEGGEDFAVAVCCLEEDDAAKPEGASGPSPLLRFGFRMTVRVEWAMTAPMHADDPHDFCRRSVE
jgi:hypothetical protein